MLISAQHENQVRVAIVDGTKLEGYQVDMEEAGLCRGNIYRGVVANIQPSLNAAFIDIGEEKHGFLPIDDILPSAYHRRLPPDTKGRPRIDQVAERGKPILVQVTKDGVGNKGPALTTNVALAGRYLVMMPFDDVRGISRKVLDETTRKTVKQRLAKLTVPEGMGVIVRTNGLDQNQTTLNRDLGALNRLWRRIDEERRKGRGPRLIYTDQDLILQALRDSLDTSIEQVIVDHDDAHAQVERYMATFLPRSKTELIRYTERLPLFSRHHLETQIDRIYSHSVPLPSGGSIVIDPTEALTAIDVNSGRATKTADHEESILNVNLEAAHEVARQLRLRDIGGLVVVDFIDMRLRKNQRKVEKAMRDGMKPDPARNTVARISANGLIEINRQRIKQALRQRTHRACPTCGGIGTIASLEFAAVSLLGRIEARAAAGNLAGVIVGLHPEVADGLQNQHRRKIANLEDEFGLHIEIIAAANLHRTEERVEWKQRMGGVVTPRKSTALRATDLAPEPERRRRGASSTQAEDEENDGDDNGVGEATTSTSSGRRRRRGGRRRRRGAGDSEPESTVAKTSAAEEAVSTPTEASGTGEDGDTAEAPPRKRRRRGSRGGRKRKKAAAAEGRPDGEAPEAAQVDPDRIPEDPRARELGFARAAESAGQSEDDTAMPIWRRRTHYDVPLAIRAEGAVAAPDDATGSQTPDASSAVTDGDAAAGQASEAPKPRRRRGGRTRRAAEPAAELGSDGGEASESAESDGATPAPRSRRGGRATTRREAAPVEEPGDEAPKTRAERGGRTAKKADGPETEAPGDETPKPKTRRGGRTKKAATTDVEAVGDEASAESAPKPQTRRGGRAKKVETTDVPEASASADDAPKPRAKRGGRTKKADAPAAEPTGDEAPKTRSRRGGRTKKADAPDAEPTGGEAPKTRSRRGGRTKKAESSDPTPTLEGDAEPAEAAPRTRSGGRRTTKAVAEATTDPAEASATDGEETAPRPRTRRRRATPAAASESLPSEPPVDVPEPVFEPPVPSPAPETDSASGDSPRWRWWRGGDG